MRTPVEDFVDCAIWDEPKIFADSDEYSCGVSDTASDLWESKTEALRRERDKHGQDYWLWHLWV